jgi:hypothetical protein
LVSQNRSDLSRGNEPGLKREFITRKNNNMKKITLIYAVLMVLLFSCQKNTEKLATQQEITTSANPNTGQGHLQQTKTFSSEGVESWITMQLNMLRVPLPAGTSAPPSERCQAYCGITLYESVLPGMPAYQSLYGQLTSFPEMPSAEPGKAYHWAASANAALAEINRLLFPATAQVNKDAMNHLEDSLRLVYSNEADAATLHRSIVFGKEVATRVFAWASTDGFFNVNPPYVPPPPTAAMPWLWVPTATLPSPPNPPGTPAPAANPYAYQRRLLVPGVSNGTSLAPPPVYSTTVGSDFWNMAKDVYDKKNNPTPDQQASAIYYRDAPGYPGGGHFISVLLQTIHKAKPMLDVAALAYAKIGIAQIDATIITFTNKYIFNLVRPVTYIKQHIDPNWSTLFPTPNHPEFPSAHATIGSAVTTMLTDVFGPNFQLTLHTYDYMNLPPRSYNSFEEMGIEMSNSRVYGGIHYQATCDKSRVQGIKVAENILGTVKFLKE